MCVSVDLLLSSFDSDIARSACEVARETTSSIHWEEKDFPIDFVTALHV